MSSRWDQLSASSLKIGCHGPQHQDEQNAKCDVIGSPHGIGPSQAARSQLLARHRDIFSTGTGRSVMQVRNLQSARHSSR